MSARKRQRRESRADGDETSSAGNDTTSTGNGASGEARVRDEEFWFQDGNVVLVARNIEFRVYKGILANHSPVFKDMFSLPQPHDVSSAPTPVVDLADSPSALRHLLRFFFPKTNNNPFIPHDPSPHTLAATIKLAHKYQISDLLEHSVQFLRRWYPNRFSKWCALVQKLHELDSVYHGRFAIVVVNIARLLGDQTLLPFALVECCSLGADILDGFEHEDGSHETLSLADLRICLDAQQKLTQSTTNVMSSVFVIRLNVAACSSKKLCQESLEAIRSGLIQAMPIIHHPDPIAPWSVSFETHRDLFCEGCLSDLINGALAARKDMWANLPGLLNITLDGWIPADQDSSEGD